MVIHISENLSVFRPCALEMSTSTQAIKLEVQNDGMEEIRDAAKRKGRKSNFKYNKGFCHGKKQRVTQVAMTRYQGSRQRGKVLPGNLASAYRGPRSWECFRSFLPAAAVVLFLFYVIYCIARTTPQGVI